MTTRSSDGATMSPLEQVAVAMVTVLLAGGLLVWLTGGIAGVLFGGGWPALRFSESAGVLPALSGHLDDPRQAWPSSSRDELPGPFRFYVAFVLVLGTTSIGTTVVWRHADRLRTRPVRSATWARAGDLRPLVVRHPRRGRVTIGRSGSRLLAAEPGHSVFIAAPTGSLKTHGLVIPALVEWQGPALVTSIKTDVLDHTLRARARRGDVLVFDPAGVVGPETPRANWTPLARSETWRGAQQMAKWMSTAAQGSARGLTDGQFWYAAAAKLLAPLLFAAASSGRAIADVVTWIDTWEEQEVLDALEAAAEPAALTAAQANWRRDERQRSSIYTTAEEVLAAYADPVVQRSAVEPDITADRFLDGDGCTLYLVAPPEEQERLRPLFVALVREIGAGVYDRAARAGGPLDPAVLFLLDEAANVAPLPNLATLASTGRDQGLQVLVVVQDLAQVKGRWGADANTIVNNHRAKVFGAGLSDLDSLDYAGRLLGEEEVRQRSATSGHDGHRSTTESTAYRHLAPVHLLRQGRPGEGILVYGHLPPTRLQLRPWFKDRGLRRRVAPGPG